MLTLYQQFNMTSHAVQQRLAATQHIAEVNRSPLFELPPELRLLIYKEYVAALTHRTVKTRDIKQYRKGAATLLSTSSIALSEALPIVLCDVQSLKATLEMRIHVEKHKQSGKPRLMNILRNCENLKRVDAVLEWIDDVSQVLQ